MFSYFYVLSSTVSLVLIALCSMCMYLNCCEQVHYLTDCKTAQLILLFCFINTCVGNQSLSIQTGLNGIIFSWTEIRHPGFTFTYGHLQRNATLCVGSNLQLLQTDTDRWQPLNRRRRLQMLAATFVSVVPPRADCLSVLLCWKPTQRRELWANMEASFPQSRPATGTELETMRLAFRAKPSAAVRYWD